MKLKPIEIEAADGETVTLLCTHRDIWPPAHARLGSTPDALRAGKVIDDAKYQQLQTWEKVCGLMEMSGDKCPTCPLALHENGTGHLVPFAPDGKPTRRLPPFARAKQGKDVR
jgi:hypothetical protein